MTAHKPTTVPRLRFPEFQDAPDWKTGRCRDIAKVLPGYGFPDKFQGNKKGQYPFYKVSDISHTIEKGQRYISEANNYIDSDVLDTIRGKSVPAGTIIFAKIGEAIRSNRRVITTKPAVIDNNTAGVKALKAKSFDEFLFYLWSNVSLIDHAGGVVPAVSKSALESVPLCYPSDPAEQQRIADCLGSLDDLIAAEGRKLEALRQHKQGLMQELFPQPGETVPRLRFPEFREAGEWEERLVGDVFKVTRGEVLAMPLVRDSRSNETPFPVYSSQTKNRGLAGYYSDYLYEDAITWTTDGANAGDVNYRTGKFFCTNVCGVLIDNDGQANLCTAELINSVSRQHVSFVGNPKLMNGVMAKIAVPFPALAEQQRIATCLSSLEDVLAAQARKIDALKQQKQGLLQQFFPSLETE